MATKEEQVENLFGKLDTQLRNCQTKRALKTADEVLKLSPGDVDALGCKVALLIDLGSVADALQLIDAKPALAARLAFERAYCAYRLGRLQDALAALQGVDAGRTAARLQLEAQLQYRLGNYRDAVSLYTQLFLQHPKEASEAQANIIAAYVASGAAAEVPSALSSLRIAPRASFEVAFNVACGLLADGKLPEADQQLQVAQKMGEESLYEEELEEEEVAAELAPVAAQLAYLAARQGQLDEAIQGLQGVLALSDSSGDDATAATAATAATNLCAVVLRQNPGERKTAADALKKLEPFLERSGGALKVKAAVGSRLGGAHTEAVLCAFASTALVANKGDAAKEAVRGMEQQFPASAALPLLRASLLARDNKLKEAGVALQAAAAAMQSSPAAVDAQLMRVQLAAAGGDVPLAASLLAELPALQRERPAVVATRVALLEKQGDVDGAAAVMAGEMSGGGGAPAAARWVQRRLASLEVERGNLAGAVGHLRALVEADASALEDSELLALLPRLMALSDPASAPFLLAQLPPPPALRSADLDALEAAGISAAASQRRAPDTAGKPSLAARKAEVAEATKGDGAAAAKKAAKKRKRKTRLPKGFDPANPGPPPDPERWLPKWQRSDAKKRKKRRDKLEVIKGSQGAGVVDSSLDKSGAIDAAPAEAAAIKAPPGGKKKGKGRR